MLIRAEKNPILTRDDIPAARHDLVDVSSVFNPGAIRFDDRDRLLLRVQTRGRTTVLMAADETETGDFIVRPRVSEIDGLDAAARGIFHVYDPRLTMIDGTIHVVFAADTDEGCRLGIARTTDLERLELVSYDADGDRRNGVLFPEKIGGRFVRLERPNDVTTPGTAATGSTIVIAESDDLVSWREVGPVMSGRWHYWDELIGSGPPPIRTDEGWLHIYHGVATHFAPIYQVGVVLLDLDDPCRVIARGPLNILEPRELYEVTGQVPNVVFPGGLTVVDDTVRVYYGAADTCVGVATASLPDLLAACREGP
jgi:beta-1,4-mannooligosaccharide/beta-1,4-mannosyl-N-acetylglucosamine phosphorylase